LVSLNETRDVQGQISCVAGADPQVELDSGSDSVRLCFIQGDWMDSCIHDVCAFDVGKSRSNGPSRIYQARVAFASNITDLGADVLTFTIAIRPDVEILAPASFGFDVLGDALFSVFDERFDPRFEQRRRIARAPFLEPLLEVVTDQMAGHGGHDHIALAPGRKVELEFIVFVVCRICDVSLHTVSIGQEPTGSLLDSLSGRFDQRGDWPLLSQWRAFQPHIVLWSPFCIEWCCVDLCRFIVSEKLVGFPSLGRDYACVSLVFL
jgi:hypothetical protein